MELKELDKLAKLNEPLPTTLMFHETSYYLSARCLYRQYDKGELTLEQARVEKEKVIEQFHENKEMYEFLIEAHQIRVKFVELREQGFNSVLEWEILEALEKL